MKHRVTIAVLCTRLNFFYDHEISIVKHFSVGSIKSEFQNKEKVEF